jgi:hydrogenase maturation protease
VRVWSGRLTQRARHVSIDFQPYAQPPVPLTWPPVDEGPARVGRPASVTRRVLVAAVGYRNLRDLSIGPLLIDHLRDREWPAGVQVEDLSFGAIHVLHWLQEQAPFDAVIFVAGAKRDRQPGTVTRSLWRAPDTAAEAVQASIAEAVTGVISLDTLLIVLGYFEALPDHVALIEIEPRDDEWGPELSEPVAQAFGEAGRLVEREVQNLIA